jgi:hypothetical protein
MNQRRSTDVPVVPAMRRLAIAAPSAFEMTLILLHIFATSVPFTKC